MEKQDKKKPLFAVAYMYVKKGHWETEIEYLHADDAGNARFLFCAGNTMQLLNKTMRIVAVGPAVGYFVEDKQGLILSAS